MNFLSETIREVNGKAKEKRIIRSVNENIFNNSFTDNKCEHEVVKGTNLDLIIRKMDVKLENVEQYISVCIDNRFQQILSSRIQCFKFMGAKTCIISDNFYYDLEECDLLVEEQDFNNDDSYYSCFELARKGEDGLHRVFNEDTGLFNIVVKQQQDFIIVHPLLSKFNEVRINVFIGTGGNIFRLNSSSYDYPHADLKNFISFFESCVDNRHVARLMNVFSLLKKRPTLFTHKDKKSLELLFGNKTEEMCAPIFEACGVKGYRKQLYCYEQSKVLDKNFCYEGLKEETEINKKLFVLRLYAFFKAPHEKFVVESLKKNKLFAMIPLKSGIVFIKKKCKDGPVIFFYQTKFGYVHISGAFRNYKETVSIPYDMQLELDEKEKIMSRLSGKSFMDLIDSM